MIRQERPTSQVAGTAAFSKFVHLLQIVADTPEPLTVADLAKISGYPRPTVYRTVAALVAERLLEEGAKTGRLSLGPRLIHLAHRSWGQSELRLASLEDLKRLRDITGETVHLAVANGHQMVYVEKLESPSADVVAHRDDRCISFLGRRQGISCGSARSRKRAIDPGATGSTPSIYRDDERQSGCVAYRNRRYKGTWLVG
jgi:hypothetical protein